VNTRITLGAERVRFSVLILAAMIALGIVGKSEATFLVETGESFPESIAEKIVAPDDMEPKATMVIMFACENERCGEMAAAVEEFVWQELRDQGLLVVGIARDASKREVGQLRADHGLTFPILSDQDRAMAKLISEEGRGIPRTVIFDQNGVVKFVYGGYRQGRELWLKQVAEQVMTGGTPAMPGATVESIAAAPSELVGKPAPELFVENWVTKDPAGTEEGKFVLVEFWATWCGPCVWAMPELQKLSNDYSDQLVIKSISNEAVGTVETFVDAREFTYPIGTDTQGRTANAVGVTGIPHGYLINPEGVVVWEGHPVEFKQRIHEFLKPPKSKD